MSADAEGPAVLGLDVGTRGTKGLVLDLEQNTVVARASCEYGLLEGLPEGAAEQHPDLWIGAVASVCKELLESRGVNARRVVGLGVSGQQHGLVVLDEDDEVVRPAKLWCDTSTVEEAKELSSLFGRAIPTGYTASKILWLVRHEPDHWKATCRVLLPHDYVNLRLTGRATMEAGDASGTGFFDPVKRATRYTPRGRWANVNRPFSSAWTCHLLLRRPGTRIAVSRRLVAEAGMPLVFRTTPNKVPCESTRTTTSTIAVPDSMRSGCRTRPQSGCSTARCRSPAPTFLNSNRPSSLLRAIGWPDDV